MEYFIIFLAISFLMTLFSYATFYFQFGRKVKCKCTAQLKDKTVLITGGSSGIGKATAKALASMGARVIIASSNTFKCIAAVQEIQEYSGNRNVDFYQVDLSDLASVRKCAEAITNNEQYLHILVNNAGIGYHEKAKTKDGYAWVFATNYLGHFLLTYLLVGQLKRSAPARVVNVTSLCQRLTTGGLKFELHAKKYGSDLFPGLRGYESSKLALMYFTKELSRRLSPYDITVNAVHPGVVVTSEIWTKAEVILPKPVAMLVRFIVSGFSQTPEVAAQTIIHAAISQDLNGISGKYFERCQIEKENEKASDTAETAHLWNISMTMTGCTYGGKVVQQLPYENDAGHDIIKAYEYLTRATLKPLTSPQMEKMDRRYEVPSKHWFSPPGS